VITRQAVITMTDLASMGSGALVMQWLRGQGINPKGDVWKERITRDGIEYMVYTERGEDERPEKT
jgi:hypothetical protein